MKFHGFSFLAFIGYPSSSACNKEYAHIIISYTVPIHALQALSFEESILQVHIMHYWQSHAD